MLDPTAFTRGEVLHSSVRSVVFRATHGDDRVVVKLLTEEHASARALARFRYAYEIADGLSNPHVARPIELTELDGRPCLVMEDIGGRSLDQHFADRRPSLTEALEIAVALTRAVAALHEERVVHLDLKPSNVVLARGEVGLRIQLIDFDIAMRISQERVPARHPESMEGTLAYISPEQTGRTNSSVDGRSDLYSLGVTLYWLFVGRLPFRQTDPLALLHAHLAGTPPPLGAPGEFPPALEDLVDRLLQKSPSERYQWPAALLRDLERIAREHRAGTSATFEIGTTDRAGRLLPPSLVVGREKEVRVLEASFERTTRGHGVHVLLVSGYSGIGKSALVRQLREPVIRLGGRFLQGKHDERSPAPHGALVQALTGWVETVISAPASVQSQAAATLRDEVAGGALPVLAELVPSLALLVGPQPSPVELPPNEAAARLAHAITRFLAALGVDGRGTVLFLDDLHWADPASLTLLASVVAARELGPLLIVGAYRDNAVEPGHPLSLFQARLDGDGHRLDKLALGPLPEPSVTALVAATLGEREDTCTTLGELVHARTGGNPFFIHQFLAHLEDRELLSFDPARTRWTWESDGIRREPVTDNVAELVVRRMESLAPTSLTALQAAACIGDSFELGLLARVLEVSLVEAARLLEPALLEGLIEPQAGDWRGALALREGDSLPPVTLRFPHDSVREGAMLSIPPEERGATHLRLGRLLVGDDPTERLFAVVQQLNAAGDLVEGEERRDLARWNLQAGRRAEEAAAWTRADALYAAGLARLDSSASRSSQDLVFELHRAAAQTAYLTADTARMERLIDAALDLDLTPVQRAGLYLVRMRAAVDAKQPAAAVDVALSALDILGVSIPAKPNLAQLGLGLLRCRWLLARLDDVELRALPKCDVPRIIAAQEIIGEVLGSAYLSEPKVMPILVFEMIQMTVQFGRVPSSGYALCTFGGLVGSQFGAVREVRRFRDLAIELSRSPEAAEYLGRTLFSVGDFLVHWQGHLDGGLALEEEAWDVCRAQGDLEYAGFAAAAWSFLAWMTSRPLTEIERRTEQYADALEHQGTQQQMVEIFRQLAHNLMGKGNRDPLRLTGTTRYDEERNRRDFEAAGDRTSLAALELFKCQMACLLGRWEDALLHARAFRPLMEYLRGAPHWPWFHFYEGLAHVRTLDAQRSRRSVLRRVRSNLARLRRWAEHAPENYGWRADLLEAELARVEGRDLEAINLFEAGIGGARKHGYLAEVALGSELAARHHEERGRPELQRAALKRAVAAWAEWGAVTRLAQLQAAHPSLVPAGLPAPDVSNTGLFTLDRIDVLSLLKATEAIAGEIELPALLRKLTAVIVENGGAEGGAVLLRDGRGGLALRARQSNPELAVELVADQPLDEAAGRVPATLLRYVARMRKPVVLNDVPGSPRFAADPYFVTSGVTAALAAPIERQGKSIGVIYLEKRSRESGFPESRTEVIQLLSGPAAIALENARLYEDVAGLSRAHQRFVPQAFLEQLGRGSIRDVRLGDQALRSMTALFADIRGFTRLSEQMEPADVFTFINEIFAKLVPVIESHGGFVDKYIGDAILALFPSGPDAAAEAALELMRAVDAFNVDRQDRDSVAIGVGINSGMMMLGTVGTPKRLEATVLSDAVNVAAHLEGLTKGYGAPILLSERAVGAFTQAGRFRVRRIGVVMLKGRAEPLAVYELLGLDATVAPPGDGHFARGLAAFQRGDFAECIEAMEAALIANPHDGPAAWYLTRAQALRESGQDPTWSGIIESV